jgi:hypothetical protein
MRSLPLTGVLCVFLSFAAAGCSDDDDTGTGATGVNDTFVAALAGANEVPPTTTGASGTATVTINGASASYRLDVQSINDVVGAHIHSGAVGVNGPVRVTLVGSAIAGASNGTIAQGTFSAADVSGITYDELVAEIRNGGAYVNVHTTVNRGGEIRAQLLPPAR